MSSRRDSGRWPNRSRTNMNESKENYKLIVLNETRHEEDSDEENVPDNLLRVSSIDQNIRNNVNNHHTDEFDITDATKYDNKECLVIRRGQKFTMTINFNRSYDPKTDDLRIVFLFGKNPLASRGTRVEFIPSDKDDPNDWGALIKKRDGTSLDVVVMTPATCYVGKWSLNIDVVKREEDMTIVYRHMHKPPIYVLFNPWCKDDAVFMNDEGLRNEYVLNENGTIYRSKNYDSPWVFGQFSGDVLDCVMYLLDKKAKFPDYCRGDPVALVRKISSLVNNFDNEGVLEGNWRDSYDGGTPPMAWTGSVAILEEFYKTRKPVKYGQCWVFSGVVTTVCRALGIPARSVTNFSSARDKDGSTTIDMIYSKRFGKEFELDESLSDSVWNFHVWNEVWMTRPNFPLEYSGWQAIDATPQEVSAVSAVKRGDVNIPFDGPFLFAEVNGDTIVWLLKDDGSMSVMDKDRKSVGRNISTRRVGGAIWERGRLTDREDITLQYKYREGSIEGNEAVIRAGQYATTDKKQPTDKTTQDVKFEIEYDPEPAFGEPIPIRLKLKNTSDSPRTIDGILKLTSLFYTGVAYRDADYITIEHDTLKPNEERQKELNVDYAYYLFVLKDHCLFKISSMFTVYETNQVYTSIYDLSLKKPDLNIEAPDSSQVGNKFAVSVSFYNSLPVELTKCEIRVEGPGHQKAVIYKQPNVPGKETFTYQFDMLPVKTGQKEIVVLFHCTQMSGVSGKHQIAIKPKAVAGSGLTAADN